MSTHTTRVKIIMVNSQSLVVLPQTISAELPSRGMVMIEGILNNRPFQAPLEPDGRGGHWLKISPSLQKKISQKSGNAMQLTFDVVKDWPEPELPSDMIEALHKNAAITSLWSDITPMARWDWLRWVNGTANPQTRAKRITVMVSKLKNGNRRPCCFNRTMCTDTSVAKSGVLLVPETA